MSITSLNFFVFSLIGIAAYYVTKKNKWIILLLMSLFFYFVTAVPYTFIYVFISVITVYFATNIFEADKMSENARRIVFWLTLLANIGILAFLKYNQLVFKTAYIIKSVRNADATLYSPGWIAALGISYYTLQITGYLVDVYWGNTKAEKNIFKVLLYTIFFPQITSGPISRYDQVKDTLFGDNKFDYKNVTFGMQRVLWGLFKKLVIAEKVAIYINFIYSDFHTYSGLYSLSAILLFPIQMYADFSGCMDIVIGCAECFGISLPENFKNPFYARTMQEFWQKWHITLGSWLKDYLLTPLLMTRFWIKFGKTTKKRFGKKIGKKIPVYTGMLILWLGMGLWHGGEYKYILGVGLWFWFVLILEDALVKPIAYLTTKFNINTENFGWHFFQSAKTYILYAIGAVFFRANGLGGALGLFRSCVKNSGLGLSLYTQYLENASARQIIDLIAWLFFVLVAVLISGVQNKGISIRESIGKQNIIFRWLLYFILIFTILIFGQYGPNFNTASFLYQAF